MAEAAPLRRIHSQDCLAEGAAVLAARDPRLAAALEITGPLPLRLRQDGFGALFEVIIGQQISVAAAHAIALRVAAAGLDSPEALAEISDAGLRACGLSRPKIRTVKALAAARIDYAALRHAPAAQVIQTLTQVPGIGPWSAEIYAMFALGHADVFAPGDLALQEGARLVFGLKARPTAGEMRQMAQDWAPWRAVAARLLWAYYKEAKAREGLR